MTIQDAVNPLWTNPIWAQYEHEYLDNEQNTEQEDDTDEIQSTKRRNQRVNK
jgi:hypothetical protein